MNPPSTTEQFIQKAKEVHGDKYDYSKVKYTVCRNKVIIICPIHGEFKQIAANHLNGNGCRKCNNVNVGDRFRLTQEQFIQKAKAVHGDKYDYSKVVYVNSNTKVIIVCPIHGEFDQTPNNHLKGNICYQCSKDNSKYTTEEFITKAITIHGDKYDYSKVNYVYSKDKVIIICPIHGEFEQTAITHLNGTGCGNKYDYNKVVYINNHTKVVIVCPMHGEFEQAPNSHLNGKGCPICNASKGELAIKAILDKHNINYKQQYRIPEIVNVLFYDFYLPEHNLLIEFHGRQHYEYSPYFHRTEDGFLAQKNRDDMVRHNAWQFKYRYIEINYKQFKQMTPSQFELFMLNKINSKFFNNRKG